MKMKSLIKFLFFFSLSLLISKVWLPFHAATRK